MHGRRTTPKESNLRSRIVAAASHIDHFLVWGELRNVPTKYAKISAADRGNFKFGLVDCCNAL